MRRASKPSLHHVKGQKIPDLEGVNPVVQTESDHQLRSRLATAVNAVCPPALRIHQEDIVQVAMMAVLRQREKEGKRRFPASYLRKAAYTAMIDEMRRLRLQDQVPLEDDDLDEGPTQQNASPETWSISREISAGIRACLEGLAAPRRSAVTLKLLGNKVPEIARRMGWTRKQAENLVCRGMVNLRDCLRVKGLTP